MNTIWFLLMSVSIIFSIINGKVEEFTRSIFDAAKSTVEISLFLLGIISLWLGITKIIEDSGLINRLTNIFKPLISRLFKNIPENHTSITTITLNLFANLLGLGNAATPLGIKAMQDLQNLSDDKENMTFEMMLFIVINTSSIQLIPFTVIGILSDYGSSNPTIIVLPIIISTVTSTFFAIMTLFAFRKFFKT